MVLGVCVCISVQPEDFFCLQRGWCQVTDQRYANSIRTSEWNTELCQLATLPCLSQVYVSFSDRKALYHGSGLHRKSNYLGRQTLMKVVAILLGGVTVNSYFSFEFSPWWSEKIRLFWQILKAALRQAKCAGWNLCKICPFTRHGRFYRISPNFFSRWDCWFCRRITLQLYNYEIIRIKDTFTFSYNLRYSENHDLSSYFSPHRSSTVRKNWISRKRFSW